MTTLRKRLARIRRRFWPLAPKHEASKKPSATPPLMSRSKAEALALVNLPKGLEQLKRHPKKVRVPSYYRLAEKLLARNRLPDSLAVNTLANCQQPEFYSQRAVILHALGNVPAAIENAAKSHDLDPFGERAVRLLASFAPDRLLSTRRMERLVYASPDPGEAAARASIAMFRAGRTAESLRAMKRMLDRLELTPFQRDQITYHAGVTAEFSSRRVALRYFGEPSPEGSKWATAKTLGKSRCLLALGRIDAAHANIPEIESYCATRLEVNLALGKIGEAYSEYLLRPQVRRLKEAFPNFLAPGPQQLVLSEGGPGDEIRFASLIKDAGATIVTCSPRLHSLMSRSFPSVRFIPVHRTRYEFRRADHIERDAVPSLTLATFMDNQAMKAAREVDGVASYTDLVARLRPSRNAFPRQPSLIADPLKVAEWRSILSNDGPNIAISWRSMLYTVQRAPHYVLADQLSSLKDVKARFWLFQPGMRLDEYALLRDMLGAVLPPLLDVKDDFEGQAAFLSCMDAVVAPYTTTAELAGALGVPTLMMALTPSTQWRRNPDGSDVWHGSGRVLCGSSTTMGDQIARALNAYTTSSEVRGHTGQRSS